MNTRQQRLFDLIRLWESARDEDRPLSPEQLCADCPELIDELRLRLTVTQAPPPATVLSIWIPPVVDPAGPPDTAADEVGATRPPSQQEMAALVAAVVPGYEILGELGRGGMGVVYKARQAGLNRVVALKMIRTAEDDDETLARFRREAEAIARLQHPNIVQVFEIGEHNGQPFFSLELCPGGSLDRRLRGQPMAAREAAELVERLARAMDVAHRANVVHRDLKPANVLLAADGSPKITDFGLARKLDETGQTRHGSLMGSPPYMPPEQARGETDALGPAVDIYALGATLYECLTGRPPFLGQTVYDTIAQVINDEPVPPARLNRAVPRDLETVCLKALHKQPGGRYATAGELADDLRRFRLRKPVLARPTSRLERLGKWAWRSPFQATALAAVVALTLMGVVALYGPALST